MHNKDKENPAYLVDWHNAGYSSNESILKVIKKAKEDLITFKNYKKNEVFQKAYDRYKLKWMLDHKYTLTELLTQIQKQMDAGISNIAEAMRNVESSLGIDEDDFREIEWKDDECIHQLLPYDEYVIWHSA